MIKMHRETKNHKKPRMCKRVRALSYERSQSRSQSHSHLHPHYHRRTGHAIVQVLSIAWRALPRGAHEVPSGLGTLILGALRPEKTPIRTRSQLRTIRWHVALTQYKKSVPPLFSIHFRGVSYALNSASFNQ